MTFPEPARSNSASMLVSSRAARIAGIAMRSVDTERGCRPRVAATCRSVARRRSSGSRCDGSHASPAIYDPTASTNRLGQPRGTSMPTLPAETISFSSSASPSPARVTSMTTVDCSQWTRHAAVFSSLEARSMPSVVCSATGTGAIPDVGDELFAFPTWPRSGQDIVKGGLSGRLDSRRRPR